MNIEILDAAREDLVEGGNFYERRETGLGDYFLDCLFSDVESLILFAGVHPIFYGLHRSLSKRFPFAIYYAVAGDFIRVYAVLDCRRRPAWIRKRVDSSR